MTNELYKFFAQDRPEPQPTYVRDWRDGKIIKRKKHTRRHTEEVMARITKRKTQTDGGTDPKWPNHNVVDDPSIRLSHHPEPPPRTPSAPMTLCGMNLIRHTIHERSDYEYATETVEYEGEIKEHPKCEIILESSRTMFLINLETRNDPLRETTYGYAKFHVITRSQLKDAEQESECRE